MIKIEAFLILLDMINNQSNSISPIGELSPLSRTYEPTDLSSYYDQSSDMVMQTFKCYNEATGEKVVLTPAQQASIFDMVKDSKNGITQATIPSPELTAAVMEERYTPLIPTERLTDIYVGELITSNNVTMPNKYQWTINGNYSIKLWVSDTRFQDEYEHYTLSIIPPVADITAFNANIQIANRALNETTITKMLERANEVKALYPYTTLAAITVNYHSPYVTIPIPTTWMIVVYGNRGNHVDAFKDEIINYLLTNSTITEDIWSNYFPDLFKRKEFIIHPNWTDIAIPSGPSVRGVNNTIQNLSHSLNEFITSTGFLPVSHVSSNLVNMPFSYKWYVLNIVHGLYNTIGTDALRDIIPDYIPVPTSHIDFNRMTETTQQWVMFMTDLIMQAETMHSFTPVKKANIVTRQGVKYYSSLFSDVNHLVKARVQ